MTCSERLASLLAMALALSCGSTAGPDTGGGAQVIITTGATGGSATVGAEGGAVTSSTGVRVRIPPGALSSDVEIRVAPSTLAPPAALTALSAAYDFSPADQTFAVPVTLELPLPEGTTGAIVFLSRADGSGWDLVGGASWGGSIKVDVTRFGTAFAAAPK